MNFVERNKIRKAYEEFLPGLLKGTRRSPYDFGIDWINNMTPIEYNVWGDIRYLGLPLYPQFPVGPFFLDFGDPFNKIGIEVDSIEWHRDIDKDKRRERRIKDMGWEVYRISSQMANRKRSDFEDGEENIDPEKLEDFYSECSEGYLRKIYNKMFR